MEFNDFHNVDLIMLIRLTYKASGICVVMLQKMICWRNNFAGVCLRFESWQYFIVPRHSDAGATLYTIKS